MTLRCKFSAFILFFPLFFSCTSTNQVSDLQNQQQVIQKSEPVTKHKTSSISLLFAGDIMAHTVNYIPGKFDRIWSDIKDVVKSADLAFANIEAPVNNDMPWSSYPQFNMHTQYVESAIEAGFNVFSLANNHTNDWYLDGIKASRRYFYTRSGIWANGLKQKSGGPLTYNVIKKDGWTVLYIAYTEILNRPDYASYIDYYPFTKKSNQKLMEDINSIREQNSYDILVLSIHTSEEEYVNGVSQERQDFYHALINDCGADIIWANHPHIVKNWETYEHNGKKSFIMYANGNTISGQRTNPSFTKPDTPRDYTGDGLMIKLTLSKYDGENDIDIDKAEPYLITTFVTPSGQYVVRLLDDDLIHSLYRADLRTWSKYLEGRKKLMEKFIRN